MTKKEYNACVDSYADGLYRFILSSIKDSEKAKDLVQDAFERLWQKHEEVSGQKAKSYLFTVGYHAMIDLVRKDQRTEPLTDSTAISISHANQFSDLNEVLHNAIEKLPDVQKMVVLLRDYEGYSYAEIANITSLTEAQVKVYIYRARQFLREYIGSINAVI